MAWRDTFRRRHSDGEIDEELRAHLDMAVRDRVERGEDPDAARRAVLREFGSVRQAHDETHAVWSWMAVERFTDDLRGALRVLRRKSAITMLAAAVLALGVGANTAIFSVTRGALLRPLPYKSPDRLVMLWRAPRGVSRMATFRDTAVLERGILTSQMVVEWRKRTGAFADLAAIELWQGNLSAQMDLVTRDGAERLRAALATPNIFDALGTAATLGRTFLPDDENVAVLSDGFWRRRFGGDPSVIGRSLELRIGRDRRRQALTIVGVLPPRFQFSYPEDTELWVPVSWRTVETTNANALIYRAVARLADGVTLAQAQQDFDRVNASLDTDFPKAGYSRDRNWIEPMHDYAVGRVRPALQLLGAATALLLIVACLNVAALLLAQVVARRREIALQLALGATRIRIARQLVLESLVTAVISAVASLTVLAALLPVLRRLLPATMPRAGEVHLDGQVMAWALALSTITVLLASLVPVWRASTLAPNAELLEGGRSAAGGRLASLWRQGLLIGQLAVVSILLVGGGLLLRTFWNLQHVDLGFDATSVWTAEMRLLNDRYRNEATLRTFTDTLLERVRAIPGVTDASLTSSVPLRGVDFLYNLRRPGNPQGFAANRRHVDVHYFDVMRIALREGRIFTDRDQNGAPAVAIVSKAFADGMFPGESALGKMLPLDRLGPKGQEPNPTEIVGVVADVRHLNIEDEARPAFYLPRAQATDTLLCLVVKTSTADSPANQIREVVKAIDPEQPVQGVTTLDDIVAGRIADRRFYAIATATFSIVALLLAVGGLYGTLARNVSERIRELGIRAALGAGPKTLLRSTCAQGFWPIVFGVTLGLLLALWATRLIRAFLYGVSNLDPLTILSVTVLIVAAALAAIYLPARRAARLDVVAALRHE